MRIVVPEHVLVRAVDDELVLLSMESEEYFGLDPVGARIWTALVETEDVDEAVALLLQQFDVEPDRLRGDVEQLIGTLAEAKLIEAV